MDISVLTEQRREMVINLLKGMKIRKSDGEGFDKDDVYACMQQLCDVYEKSIDDLTVSYETEIGELQDKYQKYDENNDLYISLIMEAKKSSNEIINKAKSEVDEILAAGKEQIAAQEDEIEKFRQAVAEEKALLSADLDAARSAAEQEKADLAAGIEEERIHSESAREQYRDQLAVMDQEFEEIKTNILRTAGKIDGLKAQLENVVEEPQWQIQDEPEVPAEEPAPEAPEELSFEQLVAKLQEEDAANAGMAEVEAPIQTPEVEPEVEAPAPEAPVVEEFNFEPVFDTPAQVIEEGPFEEPPLEFPEEEVPAEEIPAPEVSIDELAADIPVDVPAEPQVPEFNLDSVVEEAKEEVAPEAFSLDSVVEEAKTEVAAEGLGNIEDLALEDIGVEPPQEAPAVEEEPVEEISFEGLEELFKD